MPSEQTPLQSTDFIAAWRQAAMTKSVKSLTDLLANDATLISPISFKPMMGSRAISSVFESILRILPDLTYTRCEPTPTGAIMVFEGTLTDGLRIEGVDLFTLNAQGLATELKVFVRPLRAATAFAQAMAAALNT